MNKENTVLGERSWKIKSSTVAASISIRGGMMAPVRFSLPDGRIVEPYYVSPWWNEHREMIEPAVLVPLRGDFFCLPFGGGNDREDEHHDVHGESAHAEWSLGTLEESILCCAMTYKQGGTIEKEIRLADESPAIYTEHRVVGFSGSYPLGHHAILKGTSLAAENDTLEDTNTETTDKTGEKSPIWKIYTASFDLGMTDPGFIEPSSDGEYYALAPGARFDRLDQVPTRWKSPSTTDCSLFPYRDGFIDLLGWYRRPTDAIAWTVAYNLVEGYAWYSLKDSRVLPATVMWIEHHGRHRAPWNGRNSCLGIEEVCGYFANGLNAPNDGGEIGRLGIATATTLHPDEVKVVRTIQGVFSIDDPSDPISRFDGSRDGGVFTTTSGRSYALGIDSNWVVGQEGSKPQ